MVKITTIISPRLLYCRTSLTGSDFNNLRKMRLMIVVAVLTLCLACVLGQDDEEHLVRTVERALDAFESAFQEEASRRDLTKRGEWWEKNKGKVADCAADLILNGKRDL